MQILWKYFIYAIRNIINIKISLKTIILYRIIVINSLCLKKIRFKILKITMVFPIYIYSKIKNNKSNSSTEEFLKKFKFQTTLALLMIGVIFFLL